MGLGGSGGAGGELGDAVANGGVIYNPRRRVVTKGATSERDEYYVSFVLPWSFELKCVGADH